MRVPNRGVIRRLSRKTLKASRTRNLIAVLAIALTTVLFTALFTIGLFPRTLIAVAVQAAYWGVTLAWMPYTLPLVLLTGFWFPCTVALLAIYPGLDKSFHLESTLNQRRDEEITAIMQERERQ